MTFADDAPAARALETLFESSPDCIKLLDCEGRLLRMNAGGAAAMDLAGPGDLLGRNWVDFWQDADEQDAARLALRRAAAGSPAECRGFLATAKGAPRWWHSVLRPVRNNEGEIACVLVVSRDVSEPRRLAAELDLATRRTEAIVQATAEIVWQSNAAQEDGVVLAGTRPVTTTESRLGWLAHVHPADRDRVDAASRAAVAEGVNYVSEYRLKGAGGAYRWVEDRVVARRAEDGRVTGWVGVITDIQDRVATHQALRDSEERLRLALKASQVGIWDVDLVRGERRWSAELKAILGLAADAVESEALLFSLIHPADLPVVEQAHRSAFREVGELVFRILRPDTGELRWILSSGSAMLDAAGCPVRRLGTLQDVTERMRFEQQLWTAANKDALTGLPNRALFHAKLDKALAQARAEASRVALMIVDLDHFKEVNDTLGHDAGDALLRAVADRLTVGCDESAIVARLGGDEFAVVLPLAAPSPSLAALAGRLVADLSHPVHHAGVAVPCSASLGLAIFPDHDPDGSEILKNADLALYAAKRRGRACHAVFEPALKTALQRRVVILQRARDLLAADDIVPFYQPKVSPYGTHQVSGFEALLRWRDGRTLRKPAELIEAFGDPEIAAQIGARMLSLVVADLKRWRLAGVPVGSVAVNVAPAEFLRRDLAGAWLGTLAAADLPPSVLQMEVTESVFLGEGSDAVGDALRRLHEGGIAIALDDFGTGFASLTHLRTYPVDWIKIDQSFTRDIEHDKGARAIVRGTIDLAHDIGLRVVAEGVETLSQLELLAGKGCDLIQGHLVGKPMAGSRVAQFLRTPSPLRVSQPERRVAGGRR